MNTSVLLSSIFFMALSVVSGCLMMLYWSSLGRLGMLLRGYLGRRMRLRVLGAMKVDGRPDFGLEFRVDPL